MTIERGSLASLVDGMPTADYVIRMAAMGFDVTIEELVGDSRKYPVVWYRQATMAALRRLTGLSFPAIGRRFGDRDHTTVMHACAQCRKVPRLQRALESLCVEVERQWAIDTGTNMPIPGQEVLAL